MSPVVLALAIAVGLSLGMLGGGGSTLTVPLLTYVAGMSAKSAIASSSFIVAVTSTVALVAHARRGRVRWRIGALFGGFGIIGAYAGAQLARLVPGTVLLVLFGATMVLASVVMLRPRSYTARRHLSYKLGAVLGGCVGLVSGLLGAGGGFLIVPALVVVGGLGMEAAVATSLMVIAMNTSAGFAGYATHADIDWPVTLSVTGIAVLGTIAGSRFAGRIAPTTLRYAFGIVVLAMGLFVLVTEAVR